MTIVLPPNPDRQMSERELRVFEEWGPRPVQMSSSLSPGPIPQGQDQVRAQTQNPRQNPDQPQDVRQYQGQPQGRGLGTVNGSGANRNGNAGVQAQRPTSQGQPQRYGTSNWNSGSLNRNASASTTFPRRMSQSQAHGQSQPQAHGATNGARVNRSTSASANTNVNTPRQVSQNQTQSQGQGWTTESHGTVGNNTNANANPGSQTQTSQTTHKRRHWGRSKNRNRAPNNFDYFKAQATKKDEANKEKNQRDVPVTSDATATAKNSDKMKNVRDEWTAGPPNGEGGAADTSISRAEARTDAAAAVLAPVNPAPNQPERPEGPKGRSGRGRKGSRGHQKPDSDQVRATTKDTVDVVAGNSTNATPDGSAGNQQNNQNVTDYTVPVAGSETGKGQSQTGRSGKSSHGRRRKFGSISAGGIAHKKEPISVNSSASTPPVPAINPNIQQAEHQPTINQFTAAVTLEAGGGSLQQEINSKNSLSPEGSGSSNKMDVPTTGSAAGSAHSADSVSPNASTTHVVSSPGEAKKISQPKSDVGSWSNKTSESSSDGGMKLTTVRENTIPSVSVEVGSSVDRPNRQNDVGQSSAPIASGHEKATMNSKSNVEGHMLQISDATSARNELKDVVGNGEQGTTSSTSLSAGSSATPVDSNPGAVATTGSRFPPRRGRKNSRAHREPGSTFSGNSPKEIGINDGGITVSASASGGSPGPPVVPKTSRPEHQSVGTGANSNASQQRTTPRNFNAPRGSSMPATSENASKTTMNNKANTAVASAELPARSGTHISFTDQTKGRLSIDARPGAVMSSLESGEPKPSPSYQGFSGPTPTGNCNPPPIQSIFQGRTIMLTFIF